MRSSRLFRDRRPPAAAGGGSRSEQGTRSQSAKHYGGLGRATRRNPPFALTPDGSSSRRVAARKPAAYVPPHEPPRRGRMLDPGVNSSRIHSQREPARSRTPHGDSS